MRQHARHSRRWLALRQKIGSALLCAMAMVVVLGANPAMSSAGGAKSEHELRAAILYNLSRFVSWPAEAFHSDDAPLVIGGLGRNPFGAQLVNAVKGRITAEGRPLLLLDVRSDEDLERCHILLVTAGDVRENRNRIARLDHTPVLIVGETLDFVEREGGSLALILEKSKIRLYLDKAEADGAALSVRALGTRAAVATLRVGRG